MDERETGNKGKRGKEQGLYEKEVGALCLEEQACHTWLSRRDGPWRLRAAGTLLSIWVVAKFRPFLMPWVSSLWCVLLAPREDNGITGP